MARPRDDPAALPCPKCGYDLRGSMPTVINCVLFFLLVVVLLIAIGLIAPEYLTA